MNGTVSPNATVLERIFGGDHMQNVLGQAGWILEVLYALCFIASLVCFFISVARLARSADNPGARSKALHDILVSGICFTILGAIGFIFVVLVSFI